MKTVACCVLALLGAVGVVHARPVFIENVSTITNPDPVAWPGFGAGVAVHGDYALIGAQRADYSDPQTPTLHETAFLFQRSGSGWALVRQLEERVVAHAPGRHHLTVAMSATVAVVSTTPMLIYELGPSGWTLAPSDLPVNGEDSFDLEIDGTRIINGEYECGSFGAIIEKAADGVWRRSNRLASGMDACNHPHYGISADISGNWAVVNQGRADGDFNYQNHPLIFRRSPSQGWVQHDSVHIPPEQTLFSYHTPVEIRGTDVFTTGGLTSGIVRFAPADGWNFALVEKIRPVDGSMGGNDTAQLQTSGEFLLQKTLLWDRSYQPSALNVYQRQADGHHEHVAVLVHRGTAEWPAPGYEGPGNNTAIHGRTVLATTGAGVYHFELPAAFTLPAPQQETFNLGGPINWSLSAGSQYTTVRGDRSRVLRQSALTLDTRAIYQPADWTSEAIEVDVKASQFADSNSAISLITRYQGPHNYYEFVWGPSRFEFRRMASGTLRTLASYPGAGYTNILPGQNRRVRLESVGAQHQVYIDGRVHLSIVSTGPTRGRVGVSTYRAAVDFDNVQISPSPLASIYRNEFITSETVPWIRSGVGSWSFDDGYDSDVRLTQTFRTGEGRVTIGTPSAEQRVEAEVRLMEMTPTSQRQWFGVVARYVDESNHYILALTNTNRLALIRRVNGVDTWLGSFVVTVVPERYYRIRLDAVGDELRAYLDDRLLFEARDASHATGSVGMATSNAYAEYDGFTAYQP
jgi:hypothetical protein